jgi:hypothetical protein
MSLCWRGSSDTGELPLVNAAARAPDGRGWVADWSQLRRHPGADAAEKWGDWGPGSSALRELRDRNPATSGGKTCTDREQRPRSASVGPPSVGPLAPDEPDEFPPSVLLGLRERERGAEPAPVPSSDCPSRQSPPRTVRQSGPRKEVHHAPRFWPTFSYTKIPHAQTTQTRPTTDGRQAGRARPS